MKKIMLFVLALCLCFNAFGTVFAENAAAEATATETSAAEAPAEEAPKAEMTAEELYKTGNEAIDAEDYGKAMEYYQLAADLGNADALRNIGNLYLDGLGVDQSSDKALEYFQRAADLGDEKAMFNIAVVYFAGEGVEQDYGKTFEYFRKAADMGDTSALNNLGYLYENGLGVEQDYAKALEYYQQAADLDDAYGNASLGDLYYRGKAVDQDLIRAAEYYKKSLELDAEIASALQEPLKELAASLRQAGKDAVNAEDYGKAVEYYSLSADLKNPDGLFALGDCYYFGYGLEKDAGKAAEYYRRALAAGYTPEEEERARLTEVLADEDTAALEQLQSEKDETELWALAEDAYIFCYPLVLMEMTARTLPANTLVHARALANADYKSVVTMNVDTCYTQIMLNISNEPIILTLPETDRFMEMQVMDAWSNTAAVLDKPGVYAFVKKGDTTGLPEGVTKVELPTSISWVLGRVILNGDDDLPNVIEIQDGMDLCPLSVYNSGEEHNNAVLAGEGINNDIVPVKAVAAMGAAEFFRLANELMADNPPADADKPETDRIAALGVGAGLSFDPAVLQDESGDGWKAMQQKFYTDVAKDAAAYLKNLGIWSYFGEPVGDFGTEYTYRAAVAVSAFGANTTDVAIYPKCAADENGVPFDGTQDYILHFDTLPPVLDKGFWSITAYDNDDFLIANPLDRYCVNDRSDFRLNDDGSLDILLTANTGTESDMYILPTDPEGFHLFMRIYLPDTAALENWTAPVITKR